MNFPGSTLSNNLSSYRPVLQNKTTSAINLYDGYDPEVQTNNTGANTSLSQSVS